MCVSPWPAANISPSWFEAVCNLVCQPRAWWSIRRGQRPMANHQFPIVSRWHVHFFGITMLRQAHMTHDDANLIQPHGFSPNRWSLRFCYWPEHRCLTLMLPLGYSGIHLDGIQCVNGEMRSGCWIPYVALEQEHGMLPIPFICESDIVMMCSFIMTISMLKCTSFWCMLEILFNII